MWFAPRGARLYVFSAGDAGKVKRLRREARARIAPCDARGRVGGAWRDATARIVSDPAVIGGAREAFRAKYGWQIRLFDLFSRLAGRIGRRAWIEIESP